jgi:hypothetical protein
MFNDKQIPILRKEVYVELQSDLVRLIAKSRAYQNCLNCEHWKYKEDLCGKHNAKPPTEIIVYSCPDYLDDDNIPF